MSTAAGISLDDYLSTHYEPECELVNGELIPKQIGTEEHADVQIRLGAILLRLTEGSEFKAGTELSFRHKTNVRIPDIAVFRRNVRRYRRILDEPPFLCIEIASPSQNSSELFVKCETYHASGVPFCWVVDPIKRIAWEYHATMPLDRVTATLHAGLIEVALAEIFG